MEGWIKLHRQIKDHWIWKSQNRFQWWIDVLLSVNHSDSKVLIKGQLIECKRGQSVKSLETWAKDWNVTKKTVKDFFTLLQKDSMLVHEGLQITTRITVCNYDIYQIEVNTQVKKGKRRVNTEETVTTPKQECKEGIEGEEEKNKIETQFELFRINYPGTKKGFQTEFDNFCKKHPDWKEITPILFERLKYQVQARRLKKESGGFVPEWKNLQTWINQRCWEEIIGTNPPEQIKTSPPVNQIPANCK